MVTKRQGDITQLDPAAFTPELQSALRAFTKAYARFKQVGFRTERSPNGSTLRTLTTVPRSIGEDLDEARRALLQFQAEWPLLSGLDYPAAGERIYKALGKKADDSELADELDFAKNQIEILEGELAKLGARIPVEPSTK